MPLTPPREGLWSPIPHSWLEELGSLELDSATRPQNSWSAPAAGQITANVSPSLNILCMCCYALLWMPPHCKLPLWSGEYHLFARTYGAKPWSLRPRWSGRWSQSTPCVYRYQQYIGTNTKKWQIYTTTNSRMQKLTNKQKLFHEYKSWQINNYSNTSVCESNRWWQSTATPTMPCTTINNAFGEISAKDISQYDARDVKFHF